MRFWAEDHMPRDMGEELNNARSLFLEASKAVDILLLAKRGVTEMAEASRALEAAVSGLVAGQASEKVALANT